MPIPMAVYGNVMSLPVMVRVVMAIVMGVVVSIMVAEKSMPEESVSEAAMRTADAMGNRVALRKRDDEKGSRGDAEGFS